MRHVALVALIALLILPTVVQATGGVDDCPATSTNCILIPGQSVASAGPTPTFYIYVKAVNCAPSFQASCRGDPAGAPVGLDNIVYQETNGVTGLQRQSFVSSGRTIAPDHALLL